MIRRPGIIIVLILFAGVILFGYFLNRTRKDMVTDPYKVIGTDAAIVIETYDFRSLINSVTTGKGLFGELRNADELKKFNSRLQFLADQINKPGYKKLLQEGTALLSFHSTENEKLIPFFSKAIPSESGFRQLREAIIESGITGIREIRIAGKKVIELPFNSSGSNDTLFASLTGGLLIATTSEALITRSLSLTGSSKDIRDLPGFSKIHLSTGNKEDKLFLVFDNIRGIASGFFSKKQGSYGPAVSKMYGYAGGGIYLDENELSLSGYSEIPDSSGIQPGNRTNVPAEFSCHRILPSATALFRSTVFDPGFRSGLPASIADTRISRLASDLSPFIGDEVTFAYIDINDNQVDRNTLLIYELRNPMQCETIIMRHAGDKTRASYYSPDDQSRMPVYNGGIEGLGSVLMPGFVSGFNDSWFAFYDNYLVTGSSYITISRFLYDNLLNKTLANDLYYRQFEKSIPSRTGFLFYCVPSRCLAYLSGFLSEKTAAGLKANEASIGKIESIGLQQTTISGMTYNNLTVSYRDATRQESLTEWETLLDTTAGIKPFFFTNHNTGAREIFIQDTKNIIYLINAAGRVLWKVPVREKINGSVYMIDYYRNGKYQLLFSGDNYLHLIDRNGNYVERYPVRLRSPASNSLALFDYENNGNYRLVIAGRDKYIYTYDKSGSVVKGWEPFRTSGIVTAEAGFFNVSGKGFIVVSDENSVYFLDRYGKERLRPDDALARAKGSAVRLVPGSDPALVFTAPDGTVQTVFFNGKVRKFNTRTFTIDHSFDFFDIDGDGFGEYVFIDNGILYLYDRNLKEMFSKDFSSGKLGGPINFIFSSQNRKIGVFDIEKNLIYLINGKGDIMKGFPLRGASMFSIGKLDSGSDWNLIVGGTDRFLYNYKLETTPN